MIGKSVYKVTPKYLIFAFAPEAQPTFMISRCAFLFTILPVIFLACDEEKHSVELMGEYDIQLSDTITGMTFTFVHYPDLDTTVEDYSIVKTEAGYDVCQKSFLYGEEISERKYRYTAAHKELLEEYWYDYETRERLKAEIKTFRTFGNGPYRSMEAKLSFTNSDGFRKTFSEQYIFRKDTLMEWHGDMIETIVFDGVRKESKVIKWIPFIRNQSEFSEAYCYGKGIGLIYYGALPNFVRLISVERKSEGDGAQLTVHGSR